ncbi:MAG: hypothetical protein NVS2B12_14090 [Ktedonobacteraceae bacterium]
MSGSSNDRIGKRISNYKLIRLIGHGGFADVYLGEHIYLETLAAVKILHVRTDDADQPDILNEARTIAQLEHPNIVRLFEYGIEDGYPFLIMSYATNGSLRNHYPRGTRLPAELVVPYVQQMATALDYAHHNKLIHRDVKPENMLLGQNDQLLLTDFGLVMMAQTSRSQASDDLAGTIAYMAPEQLHGRPRFASDQYALGVVVYEWLCGQRPFNGSFAEIASQQVVASPPSLREIDPDLAPSVERAVLRALAKNPADRFSCVGEFARALSEAYGIPFSSTLQSRGPGSASLNGEALNVLSPGSGGDLKSRDLVRVQQASFRLDPGATVEIPVHEAVTAIYDVEASDTLSLALPDGSVIPTTRYPLGKPTRVLSSTSGIGISDTITPDPEQQALEVWPTLELASVAPARNKGLKSIFILIVLLIVIGSSIMLGFSKFIDQQGAPNNIGSDLISTVTPDTVGGAVSTVVAPGPNPTIAANESKPTATITAASVIQKVAPRSTSIPTTVPAAQPAPTSPAPTPVPPDPTPMPTPEPNSTPVPDPNALPPMPTIAPISPLPPPPPGFGMQDRHAL